MVQTVAAVIALVIVVILIAAARKPSAFQIQRSASIKAPADKIFPLLEGLRRWTAWSPWEKMDPNLKRSYTGPETGVGSAYAWEGNKKVGQGRMEIIEASPGSALTIKLDFLKPFEAHNMMTLALAGRGDATDVTWVMDGKNTFMGKLMSLFVNMDDLIGRDFERGLANLKAVAEGS